MILLNLQSFASAGNYGICHGQTWFKNSYETRKKNHKRDLKPRFESDLQIYDVDIVLHLSLIPDFWISMLISSSSKWALL